MDEEQLDSLLNSRPFRSEDATRWDADLRRRWGLGSALWGRTSDDLQRQLLNPHPEIPSDADLADLRELHQSLEHLMSLSLTDPRLAWLARQFAGSPTIRVGSQQFTKWEARREIVRRAIEFLERR